VANAIYPLWKQALMSEIPTNKSLDQGEVLAANGVYASLVDTDTYSYSESHQFYSSITGIQAAGQRITAVTITGRVFDGETVTYMNVTGTKIGAVVITRQNTGANTTWRLVVYEDTGILGVPMIPSGGNIIVTWNEQGIFGI